MAPPTFEIRPDPGVVTRHFAHELVQELGGWHRRGGLARRRLLRRCQAGRQERQFGWVRRRSIRFWWQKRDVLTGRKTNVSFGLWSPYVSRISSGLWRFTYKSNSSLPEFLLQHAARSLTGKIGLESLRTFSVAGLICSFVMKYFDVWKKQMLNITSPKFKNTLSGILEHFSF